MEKVLTIDEAIRYGYLVTRPIVAKIGDEVIAEKMKKTVLSQVRVPILSQAEVDRYERWSDLATGA
jgi:hypothetical protein